MVEVFLVILKIFFFFSNLLSDQTLFLGNLKKFIIKEEAEEEEVMKEKPHSMEKVTKEKSQFLKHYPLFLIFLSKQINGF